MVLVVSRKVFYKPLQRSLMAFASNSGDLGVQCTCTTCCRSGPGRSKAKETYKAGLDSSKVGQKAAAPKRHCPCGCRMKPKVWRSLRASKPGRDPMTLARELDQAEAV